MDLVPPALDRRALSSPRSRPPSRPCRRSRRPRRRALEEFVEEHSGEEGLLAEATNDKGKVTKGGVKDRLKAVRRTASDAESDERAATPSNAAWR